MTGRAAPPDPALSEETSAMALLAWIAVKAAKQGQFKGETTQANRRDKWMPVVAFTMDVKSPHDAATGQVSGKRQYQPITVVKQWGTASPQALAACAANEVLTEVDIEFTRPATAGGDDVVYQFVRLTNATFAQIARFTGRPDGGEDTPSSGHTSKGDMMELERWAFTFQKIEVQDNDGKTSFADSWTVTA
jgi:type VI secretion system secreted protein Hcp